VCISREIEAELAGIGIAPARCHHIPNAVDTDHFKPLPAGAKSEQRARLELPDDLTVIYTGRLAPEKRVEHLLAIWPGVRSKFPEARLLILGAGPLRPALERMAGPGVGFLGRIDDVAPYLRAADVFVLPSAWEGLSIALLEAMASGLAVIVTDVGGARDVIRPAENGWLVPPDDRAALQAGMLGLLGDASLRASLGSQARQDMERAHALPVIGGQLVALYHQLLSGCG
jgi:glycosyltransferase involved in cell wall biosynthesis